MATFGGSDGGKSSQWPARRARRHVAVMEHTASVLTLLDSVKDQTVDGPIPHLGKDLMPQVVESIVEQVRQVMSQERIMEHIDVGTV